MIDANTRLLLAVGLDHRSVGFNGRAIEKTIFLLLPDCLTNPVNGLHDEHQLYLTETTAEVSSSGWIGNPLRTKCIQVRFIIATVFHMVEASSTSKQV
jgi:hypothetical protein